MSYCRFQNTVGDLRECKQALDDEGIDGLSDDERKAAIRLIKYCIEIEENYADLVSDQ